MLTPAGELVSGEGRQLVARYDALARSVARLDPERGGSVRVHAIYSAGIALLNQLRTEFQRQRPALDVQIEYEPPAAVAESARTGRCDFGIVSYPRNSGRACSRGRFGKSGCASPADCTTNWRAQRRSGQPTSDGREVIHFTHELPAARHIRSYLTDNAAAPVFAQRLDNIDTFKSMLQATDYAAILPLRTFHAEVLAGLLAAVPLEPLLERPVGIVHARRRLRPAAQDFAAFLVENAGPMSADDLRSASHGEAA